MTLKYHHAQKALTMSFVPDFSQLQTGVDATAAGAVIAFGPNGDFDPGFLLDDIAFYNRNAAVDGDEFIKLITSLGQLASPVSRGATLKLPEGGSRGRGAPLDTFMVVVDKDSASAVEWDMDSAALLSRPNSGKVRGFAGDQDLVTGVGPLLFRIPAASGATATIDMVVRRPFQFPAGLDGYAYSRSQRTTGGVYTLNAYKVPGGNGTPLQVLASADFDLTSITDKVSAVVDLVDLEASRTFAADDVLRVTATDTGGDLSAGDLLFELPRLLV